LVILIVFGIMVILPTSDVLADNTAQCWVTKHWIDPLWKIHVKDEDSLRLVHIKYYNPSTGIKDVFHWVADTDYKIEVVSDWLPMLTDPYEEYWVRAWDKLFNEYDFVVNSRGEVELANLTSGVGGFVIPLDKFALLAPYIGLTSTVTVAAVATALYVKRVKRRREKQ